MTAHRKAELEKARTVVDELFTHPPVNDAELCQRLKDVNTTSLRRLVVDRLYTEILAEREGFLFLAVLRQIGLGRQKNRLFRIASDVGRSSKNRLWALLALTVEEPQAMEILVSKVGVEGMIDVAKLSMFELFSIQGAENLGGSIAAALNELDNTMPVDDILDSIDAYRKSIGVSCADAYAEALQNEPPARLRGKMLGFFISEGGDEEVDLLERLRSAAPDDLTRREFQAALLRLRSNLIDPARREEGVSGFALVSNCDGQGGYVLLGVFDIADGTRSIAGMCIRTGGEIRDGFVFPLCSESEVSDFVQSVRERFDCDFARVALAEGAELAAGGKIGAEKKGLAIEKEIKQAVSMFARVKSGFSWGKGACCAARPKVSKKEVRKLLERFEYSDSWFFDLGDLGALDIEAGIGSSRSEKRVQKAATEIENMEIRRRLVAMAGHMARWHLWKGEPEAASLCEAMARDTDRNFSKSALVHIMLERTAEMLRESSGKLGWFGDPDERQHFKSLYFADIEAPSGRDLALLDLTEAAASALDAAFVVVPGHRRPTKEERDAAAHELGGVFAACVLWSRRRKQKQMVTRMDRSLADLCRLSERERQETLMMVIPSLFAFVEQICSVCPVDCQKRPEQDVSHIFFSPAHPVLRDKAGSLAETRGEP